MKRRASLILAASLLAAPAFGAAPNAERGTKPFQFGVIGHAFKNGSGEAGLKHALDESGRAKLAFVLVNGIKGARESCSDTLYEQRKDLLDASALPLLVSLAASDWSECQNGQGRPAALERLNRLRDVFFDEAQSLGQRKIAQTRLSSSASFRSYAENAHWTVGRILFATINLPANNNHYLAEAGRNSEFEDRLVANRAWLKRLFAMAQGNQLEGLVLFSDGNVGALADEKRGLLPTFAPKRDGFAETRREIKTLAQKFPGKILLIDNGPNPAEGGIVWRNNLGHLSVQSNWVAVRVNPAAGSLRRIPLSRTALFTVKSGNAAP